MNESTHVLVLIHPRNDVSREQDEPGKKKSLLWKADPLILRHPRSARRRTGTEAKARQGSKLWITVNNKLQLHSISEC